MWAWTTIVDGFQRGLHIHPGLLDYALVSRPYPPPAISPFQPWPIGQRVPFGLKLAPAAPAARADGRFTRSVRRSPEKTVFLPSPRADLPKRQFFRQIGARICRKNRRFAKSAGRFAATTVFSPNRRTETPKRPSFCQIGAPAGQKNRRFPKSPCKTWFLTAATRRLFPTWRHVFPFQSVDMCAHSDFPPTPNC